MFLSKYYLCSDDVIVPLDLNFSFYDLLFSLSFHKYLNTFYYRNTAEICTKIMENIYISQDICNESTSTPWI